MIALFFILLGHTSYGITNNLWKNPSRKIGILPLILIRSFSCCLIFFVSHLVLTKLNYLPKTNFENSDDLMAFGICAVNYFGLFFYLKSLQVTQVSSTIGFGKISLVIGLAIGYFVYHEKIGLEKIIVCIVLLVAVFFVEKSVKANSKKISKGLIYTVLSRIFWATSFLFIPFIHKLGVLLFCSILELAVFLMSIILYFYSINNITSAKINLSKKTKYEILALIILGTIGTFCLNFAIANISIITFALLTLVEPVVGLIVSKIYHKEEINKLQFIGLSLGLIASFILVLI